MWSLTLISSFLISLSVNALTTRCPDFDRASELLNTRRLEQVSRDTYAASGTREIRLRFTDASQASEFAYRLPALREWGFVGNNHATAVPHIASLERSSLYGIQTGRTFRNPEGDVATIRLDWDPEKGAHYNISITRHTERGRENHRLALEFQCGESPCTAQQVRVMAERMYAR
jgi:hypothetical protein